MSAHSEQGITDVAAWLYDGRSASRHEIHVRIEAETLLIDGEPVVELARLSRSDLGATVFGRRDLPGWRLGFDAGLPAGLEAALPPVPRYGRWIDRIGLWRGAALCLLISGLTLVGASYGIDMAARLVPFSWEQQLGEAMTGDFGPEACLAPDGQRALDLLARRLSPTGRPMRVRVVAIPMVNAVALPGGRIMIFEGLIAEARSPDEVAGVLAHEIGHVEHRHVMVALIRRFGLGLLLNANDRPGEYARTLLESRYSRAAESDADAYSVDSLLAAHISPAPTAVLFARMAAIERGGGGLAAYLASHPPSADRGRRFAAATRGLRAPQPAMTAAQWNAVRTICSVRRAPSVSKRFGSPPATR